MPRMFPKIVASAIEPNDTHKASSKAACLRIAGLPINIDFCAAARRQLVARRLERRGEKTGKGNINLLRKRRAREFRARDSHDCRSVRGRNWRKESEVHLRMMRSHQAMACARGPVMVAGHPMAIRIRHRLRQMRRMRPVQKTASSGASRHLSCHPASQQRERRGKQRHDYENSLASAHGG